MNYMNPRLSVVVVILGEYDRLEAGLRVLSQALPPAEIELVVPVDDARRRALELAAQFPRVRFLALPGTLTYAELRAAGIQASNAPVVAITEDHCVPRAEWCREVLNAHMGPYAAVGGAIEKEAPDTALNWSFYFADYIRYLDPREGPARHASDCNVSYKRSALARIAPLWKHEFHENQVHEALAELGESLWLSPRVVVRQKRRFTLRAALWDRYAFGRLFGSTRVGNAPASRRLVLLGTSLLLPALLTARVAGHVRRTGRYRMEFLRALPLLVVLNTTWALGEFAGYLTGRPEEVLRTKAAGAAQ